MSDAPGFFDFAGQKARNIERWSATGWDEVASFIGPNPHHFEAAWANTRKKILAGRGGMAVGFCWPAFPFAFAWFLYRRMWLMGAVLLIVPVALALLISSPGGSIGISVAMAMFAKSLYAQHVVARIADVRAAGGDAGAVAEAGGISVLGGAIGALIIALGAAAFVYAILDRSP